MDHVAGSAPGGVIARARAGAGPGVSLVLHLGLLAAAALSRPSLGATDMTSDLAADRHFTLAVMADVSRYEMDDQRVFSSARAVEPGREARGVPDAEGDASHTGSADSVKAAGRVVAAGPADNPDPGYWRRGEYQHCCFRSIGLTSRSADDPDGLPVSRSAIGRDPGSARGNMRGPEPAEAGGIEADPARLSTRGNLPGTGAVAAEPLTPRWGIEPPAAPARRDSTP